MDAAQQAHIDDLKDDVRREQDAEWRERMVESMDIDELRELALRICDRNDDAHEEYLRALEAGHSLREAWEQIVALCATNKELEP